MPFTDLPVTHTAAGLAFRRTLPPPAATPLVLLHGIPGGSVAWAAVADDLAPDHDVIVPDLLGFGASARPTALADLHAEAQARALLGLLDEIGAEAAILVGHDFGAPTALTLARTAPDRVLGLGVLAGNLFTDTPIPFPLSTITWPILGGGAERLLAGGFAQRMLLRTGGGRPRPALDLAAHLGDGRQRTAVRTLLAGSLRQLATLYRPIEDHLPAVRVPRFVAWGDRDPLFALEQGERVADALRVPLTRLEGAGHFLPVERPDDVAALVRGLVTEVASAPAAG